LSSLGSVPSLYLVRQAPLEAPFPLRNDADSWNAVALTIQNLTQEVATAGALEASVNTAIEEAPAARIGFNTPPTDTAEVILT